MENFSESDFNLANSKCIYCVQKKVEIYTMKVRGEELVVKKVYLKNAEESNELLKAVFAMIALDYPSIVKVRSIHMGESFRYMLVVMDYYTDGDLRTKIDSRASRQNPWPEDQLLIIFNKLIDGFAFMQQKELVHRDIKPENILKKGDQYFISGLGCIYKSKRGTSNTLAGTPNYLSPKLAEAFRKLNENRDYYDLNHNVYKSDVFSLGLTFLYMANLRQFNNQNTMTRADFESNRDHMIRNCIYSDKVKIMLSKMLEYDEINRPEFLELKNGTSVSGKPANVNSKNGVAGIVFKNPSTNNSGKLMKFGNSLGSMAKIPGSFNNNGSKQPGGYTQINSIKTHSVPNNPGSIHNIGTVSNKNIEKCWACDQFLGNGLDFIPVSGFKVHSNCFEPNFKVQTQGSNVNEMLLKPNGDYLILNTKVLEKCNCGNYSYYKPSINSCLCLNCFKNWQVDITTLNYYQVFYKILSLYCIEINITSNYNQLCICKKKSIEVFINQKQSLCYVCLELYYLPCFNGQVIYCPWKSCSNMYYHLTDPIIQYSNINESVTNEPKPVHTISDIPDKKSKKTKEAEDKNNFELQNRDEEEQKLAANTKETTIFQNKKKLKPYEYMERKNPEMICIPEELKFDKLIAY